MALAALLVLVPLGLLDRGLRGRGTRELRATPLGGLEGALAGGLGLLLVGHRLNTEGLTVHCSEVEMLHSQLGFAYRSEVHRGVVLGKSSSLIDTQVRLGDDTVVAEDFFQMTFSDLWGDVGDEQASSVSSAGVVGAPTLGVAAAPAGSASAVAVAVAIAVAVVTAAVPIAVVPAVVASIASMVSVAVTASVPIPVPVATSAVIPVTVTVTSVGRHIGGEGWVR
mmetsp:Transcript_68708/g.143500  ORF Transcript_68708/g.143500 Transcript_68708/m.143500 type:complete len:224 (-) Transcript_68708:89-760(-)